MTRTRVNITGGRGEALPKVVVETPARVGVEIDIEVVIVVRNYPGVIPVEQN